VLFNFLVVALLGAYVAGMEHRGGWEGADRGAFGGVLFLLIYLGSALQEMHVLARLDPVRADCAWDKTGRPEYRGPSKPVQRFAGTDRQVRGLLLDVLRATKDPVDKGRLDLAWQEAGQRDRCLASLLTDGLVEQIEDGRFTLPGEYENSHHSD
jgi:hypothetical protein